MRPVPRFSAAFPIHLENLRDGTRPRANNGLLAHQGNPAAVEKDPGRTGGRKFE